MTTRYRLRNGTKPRSGPGPSYVPIFLTARSMYSSRYISQTQPQCVHRRNCPNSWNRASVIARASMPTSSGRTCSCLLRMPCEHLFGQTMGACFDFRLSGTEYLLIRGRRDLAICISLERLWHLSRNGATSFFSRIGTPALPRAKRTMKRSSPGSIPYLSGHALRAISGARRHGAALLSGLLSQSKSGPLLQNARLGTWEPGSSLRLRQWVTRSIREFKQRRFHHVF
jgi:hypothetical protein